MEAWIAFGGLLLLLVLSAAQHKRIPPPRDAALEDEALGVHLQAIASSHKPRGRARPHGARRSARRMRRALALLDMSVGATPEAGDLLPGAQWLVDNARTLEDAALSLTKELPRAKPLPVLDHQPRMQLLARELISHCDAKLHINNIRWAVEAWQSVQLLRLRELWTLPLILRATLVELLSHLAVACAQAQRDRVAATEWAGMLAHADPAILQRKFARAPRSTCFFEHLLKCLRDQENAAALSWLDKQLDALDLRAQRVVEREHARQTLERQWISNAITSLRTVAQIHWSELLEELSAVERWLRDDPSGVYPRMSLSSRATYRSQVERIARAGSLSEIQVARNACELAKLSQDEGELGQLTRHVGYYLLDEGVNSLWRRLGGMPMAISMQAALARRAEPLYVSVRVAATLGLCAVALWLGLRPALLIPAFFVLGAAAEALTSMLARWFCPPRTLPRIGYETLPESRRTLVVAPTLLSRPDQALRMARHLSVLRHANDDPNLHFMLLADFPDGPAAENVADADILRAGLEAIRALNTEGSDRFMYLHRHRAWNAAQQKFMGRERKRGALEALNGLIRTGHSEDSFAAASIDPGTLFDHYRQVITLDSDTILPPGAALELIGMMAHPLNRPMTIHGRRRGRAVIQPRMETVAHSVRTQVARIFGGGGGVDPYQSAASDVYQDLCGRGSFAGKGIYDVHAFSAATRDWIRPNTVLSHDLIEGELCGAALASDTVLYDSQPASLRGWMMRLHRWTRGDWQLLPWLFPIVRGVNGRGRNPLDLLSRYKIWDNLRRSLVPPMRLLLLILGTLAGDVVSVLAALLAPELRLLLSPSLQALRAAGTQLAILPYQAGVLADGAIRTVWRVFFSRRHLLEWVTAADAERHGGGIPSRFERLYKLYAWLDAPVESPIPLPAPKRHAMLDLARDTWRFFERTIGAGDNFLPPDNLQLQPARGIAHRTSPTNIGLYLLSCVSAQRLGFLDADQMARRMNETVESLEQLETWNGHLLNWYDTRTLAPLHPRYVSAVDSGNLAGCLLACAQALREVADRLDPTHRGLAARMDHLWQSMDFAALYDGQCDLFYIGMHPDTGRTGDSHYDLLASEARLLSFLAVMRGAVPLRHWQRLGRLLARTRRGAVLASWSGTMFEYLMPGLIMRLTPGTLLADTCRHAVRAQKAAAEGRPWGVSESGYYAFDPLLNYQYRAFGISQLALRSEASAQVIAPYASALALGVAPTEACDNLMRMRTMSWCGALGFYEAADYTAPTADSPYQLVRSHMAHHQGMILCALCNALTDDSLVSVFHSNPQVEAFELLLEERIPTRKALHWRNRTRRVDTPAKRTVRAVRHVHPETIPLETQLLYGEGTTLLCDARGGGYIAHNGLMLTRWRSDPLADGYGLQCFLYDAESRTAWRANQSGLPGETRFETGSAIYIRRQQELHSTLQCFVCPLDGAALHLLTVKNQSEAPRTLSVATFFEVALSAQAADEAHPAFRNLFIQTARISPNGITAQRRPRAPQERYPLLLHAAASDIPGIHWAAHTDRARFLGRDHGLLLPRALKESDTDDSVGAVVDPCMSLSATVTLPPGGSLQFAFATAAASGLEDASQLAAQYADLGAAQRALELAQTQAQVAADYLSLDPSMQHQAQRLASYMLYRGQNTARAQLAPYACKREDLWACGLSCDLPILTLSVTEAAHLPLARAVFKIHEAWRQWGLWADLVLLDDHGGEYYTPTRSALQEMVASGHARDLVGKAGGVHFLDAQVIQPHRRDALIAYSALVLHGKKGPLGAQMKAMRTGFPPKESNWPEPARLYPTEPPKPLSRLLFNGWGGFAKNGDYVIDLEPGKPTPAPWCNVLANRGFGTILNERGAGFTFVDNSHGGRLTPWMNDPVRSRPGEALYLRDEQTGQFCSLLPNAQRVTHAPGFTLYEGQALGIDYRVTVFVNAAAPIKHSLAQFRNPGEARELSVTAYAAWAFGDREEGRRLVRTKTTQGVCLAQSPNLPGCAFLAMPGATGIQTGQDRGAFLGLGGTLTPRGMHMQTLDSLGVDDACAVLRTTLHLGAEGEVHTALGWATNTDAALQMAQQARNQAPQSLAGVQAIWEDRLSRLTVRTPDAALNVMLNRWLPYQLTASRLWARAGFYQAGGAYGYRDQLQDNLALLVTDPQSVRDHLLLCAAHQFEAGDVQHWWHPPARGVRTRMTDDLLFLPYVAAAYVAATGDVSVLAERVPYLRDVDIPAGQEDWYGNAQESEVVETLLDHCLRAIRRVALGKHGIPLIGTGDWNDAMNRVGAEGQGESVWLGWFFATTLHNFAPLCDDLRRDELLALRARLLTNLEAHAWDGAWYRRAWFDDGTPLGSAGDPHCEIDCIAQSWAVLGGAIPERAMQAMESLWHKLVDREHGIVKLLTPPFDQNEASGRDPGYIQGYLPGLRENGGQYTHGAAWAVLAFARLGQVERAWEVLRMLLPTAHTGTPEQAARYRVEPYVSVADVYTNPKQTGRGGWTWYTGSAAWLWIAGMQTLLGFEKRGGKLRLSPQIPRDWDGFSFVYRHGNSTYRISVRRDVTHVTVDGRKQNEGWITLIDDGRSHEVVHPAP
ncbi:MAG: DUF3131 domain-containing protein [Clostridia bacterium]|nr:DUF3131 domain-containing protein [Clostridia bacterium]